MTTPEAAALRHHEPAIRQSGDEPEIECECGDHLVRVLTPAPEVPPRREREPDPSIAADWCATCRASERSHGPGRSRNDHAFIPGDAAPEVPARRDWPVGVNEWIEVAQQALDREGADWDHSREMAEAVASKLWNYLSDGLIPSPALAATRTPEPPDSGAGAADPGSEMYERGWRAGLKAGIAQAEYERTHGEARSGSPAPALPPRKAASR